MTDPDRESLPRLVASIGAWAGTGRFVPRRLVDMVAT